MHKNLLRHFEKIKKEKQAIKLEKLKLKEETFKLHQL